VIPGTSTTDLEPASLARLTDTTLRQFEIDFWFPLTLTIKVDQTYSMLMFKDWHMLGWQLSLQDLTLLILPTTYSSIRKTNLLF